MLHFGGKTRGNGLTLLQGRKKFFTERAVKHWNGWLREVVESQSLEVLKRHLEVALGDTVNCWTQ